MANDRQDMEFEDIPLDEARRMGRGPRMEPLLYDTLKNKIHSLTDQAARIRFGPEIRPERMKNSILRIARELKVPVTIRKVSGGLIFWRSTDEDRHQAQEVADRLQTAQRQGGSRPGRRRGASRGASTPRTSPRQGRR
jgi:hypothetical protein